MCLYGQANKARCCCCCCIPLHCGVGVIRHSVSSKSIPKVRLILFVQLQFAGPDLQIRMGMGGGGNGGEDGSGGGHPDPHIRWRSQKNFFRPFGLLPGSTTEAHSFFF